MAGDQNIVRLTYQQLKEMAEGNHEESADGVYRLPVLLYFRP